MVTMPIWVWVLSTLCFVYGFYRLGWNRGWRVGKKYAEQFYELADSGEPYRRALSNLSVTVDGAMASLDNAERIARDILKGLH